MILLLDKKQCPVCGSTKALRWDQHRCGECNARIFNPESTFHKLREDWVLSYWIFFNPSNWGQFRGWVHSDHLNNPHPNSEIPSAKLPDSSYGKRKPASSAKFTPRELGVEQIKAHN